MKRLSFAFLGLSLLGGGVVGCGYDSKEHARQDALDQKWAGKPKPDYQELRVGNRIYVAGSKASADRVQGGGKFASQQAAIGFGPARETVIFEASKDGLEELLMQEYKKRHPEVASAK